MIPQTTPTTLNCQSLPAFDPADLNSVVGTFLGRPGVQLGQSWLPEPEAAFAPATVWTGWQAGKLLVFANLTDEDIFTHATRPNQRLWELGDAFEIFLRPAGQSAYAELQISPNNQRLQLCYKSTVDFDWARKNNSIENALIHDIAFASHTWIQPKDHRWYALAEIPVSVVGVNPHPLPGSRWHVSFCRYDYTRGRSEPVISSTSSLSQPDFHRLAEWGTMQFL